MNTFLKATKWKEDLAKLRKLTAKCLSMGCQCKPSQVTTLETQELKAPVCGRSGGGGARRDQEDGLKVSREHS